MIGTRPQLASRVYGEVHFEYYVTDMYDLITDCFENWKMKLLGFKTGANITVCVNSVSAGRCKKNYLQCEAAGEQGESVTSFSSLLDFLIELD